MSDKIVKHLNFGKDAKDKIYAGINQLTKAVSSTLGASGKCVILEDHLGKPIITKEKPQEKQSQKQEMVQQPQQY